ncbi:hypothetical protein [Chryseobacterium indoltheticum]|uniref:Uncharacterized protein n=1 Tax=Chryseobacterium indoltheticum TaxID=254 RepID=A0A381JS81_9FLAO|nr:hypothetical protein [Chryseobacterium indoltheticum]AZA75650.1 hypothetical protein EG358_18740 [Chryseobacterium indoltheticum]SIQ46195.1 hypothetical protein SAMN05421682_105109 [Chryseobacterium indoltheticum]SUY53780.1 Uncharacterised protein [Chryseobacterium indoltheticum]
MKTKILTILIITIFSLFKSQIGNPINITDYPNFYNQTVNKLDNIIPNKTLYYNQSLSVFLQDLAQNNITIKAYDPGPFDNNFLKLMFVGDAEIRTEIRKYNYAQPYITITFQDRFNFKQAQAIINQHYWFWNTSSENFYKDLKVKKIEFWYVRGLTDKSINPK